MLSIVPRAHGATIWNEHGRAPDAWLGALETALREHRARVLRGGAYDTWDLEVRSGLLGVARVRLVVEEHGQGRQLGRFRVWPRSAPARLVPLALLASLTAGAVLDGAHAAASVLGLLAVGLTLYAVDGCPVATEAIVRALPLSTQTGPKACPSARTPYAYPRAFLECADRIAEDLPVRRPSAAR